MGHIGISGLKHLYDNHLTNGFILCKTVQKLLIVQPVFKQSTRVHHFPNRAASGKLCLENSHIQMCGDQLKYLPYSAIDGISPLSMMLLDEENYVYYMKTKDEAATCVKHYLTKIECQLGKLPKTVRANNGHEYVNRDLIGWCFDKGIELQTTTPYMPKQNGVAEQYNCTIVELAHTMIFTQYLPNSLWPEAMSHAAYVCNRAFSQSVPDGTPYQKWTGQKPDLSTIQEFGTDIWVLNPDPQRNKLAPKSNQFRSEERRVGKECA